MTDNFSIIEFSSLIILLVSLLIVFALSACWSLICYRIVDHRARLIPTDSLYGLLPPLWLYAWATLWPKAGGVVRWFLVYVLMYFVIILVTTIVAGLAERDRYGWSRWVLHLVLPAATLVVYHAVPAMPD